MYTNALWGTRERRAHLLSTKYFKCKCKRCSDATELGTNLSTIVCNVSSIFKVYLVLTFNMLELVYKT